MSDQTEAPRPGHPPPKHEIQIFVNNKPVIVSKEKLTGREIKQAAIDQGVAIKIDFVLFEDLRNGKQVVVKDDQLVQMHRGQKFEAITNDDNS